jgi:hypothetical protein
MKKQKRLKKKEKSLSLYPLKPEEALAAFMKIDKKKLLKAEKEAKDEPRQMLF